VYSERPSTSDVRQAGIAVLAALAALFIGFYVGSFAAGVGSPRVLSSILLRSVVCAVPATAFALLMPRFWVLPAIVYGFAFYCGYTFLDGIRVGLAVVFLTPIAALTGQRLGTPPEPTHPELLWLFVIAIWFAALTSFLRRRYSHTNEDA
jgi:hypothetical protein